MSSKIKDKFSSLLGKREKSGILRTLKPIHKISAARCEFRKKELLNFSSNDYLALSTHPALIKESTKWLEKFGTSFSASRLLCGSSHEILELESRIAEWKKCESALIIGSGYLANCGAIPALAGRKSAIFADKLNHASLNAACIQSGADFKRYHHCDYENLESFLRNSQALEKLIVSDSIFSMDGDIADVEKLYILAKKYNAFLYLDDAHASGVFGKNGEGTSLDFVDDFSSVLIMGTFSKGMGAYGAYLAGDKMAIDYLINTCSSFIYSTALPPASYGAISASLDIVQSREIRNRAKKLLKNAEFIRSKMREKKLDYGKSASQIIPIMLGEARRAVEFSERLIDAGILAVPIRPPSVPENSARIRLSLNAAHTVENIKRLMANICP